MPEWGFLTSHAQALLVIAADPDTLLREIASAIGVTERTAFAIVVDLVEAGYVVKEKDGRRNRYHVVHDLPLRDAVIRERTVGELMALLGDPSSDPAVGGRILSD